MPSILCDISKKIHQYYENKTRASHESNFPPKLLCTVGIEKPQDIKYMKILRFSLRVIAAWPEKQLEGRVPKYLIFKKCYLFFIVAICLPSGILYIKKHFKELSFFKLGHSYITVIFNIVALGRVVLVYVPKYLNTVTYFVKEIHLFNHKDNSEYAIKMRLLVHKMSHFFANFTVVSMLFGSLMFNGTPLINNILTGGFSANRPENYTFEQAIFFDIPFDAEYNFNGYFIMSIFNCYISYIVTSYFCVIDLLLSLMIFHIWGHLKILIYNMNHYPRPKLEEGPDKYYAMYSQVEMAKVHNLLRENINHHCLIKDFVEEMSGTFGLTLLIYFGFQQTTGCLLLLVCSQMDADSLVRYVPMTLVFFQQVIQVSIVFELLGSLGDTLPEMAYNIPWECMDKNNRQIMYILLKQCQKSMHVKAMDMVDMGVQTMTMVIKTSLSYGLMLRTLADLK